MNCPKHHRKLVFVRRQAVFRWFFCAGNGCQNIEWRAQDARPGVIAFRESPEPWSPTSSDIKDFREIILELVGAPKRPKG